MMKIKVKNGALSKKDDHHEDDTIDEFNRHHGEDGEFTDKAGSKCDSSYFVDRDRKRKGGGLTDKDESGRGRKYTGQGKFRCKDNSPKWESLYREFVNEAEAEELGIEEGFLLDYPTEPGKDRFGTKRKASLFPGYEELRKLGNGIVEELEPVFEELLHVELLEQPEQRCFTTEELKQYKHRIIKGLWSGISNYQRASKGEYD